VRPRHTNKDLNHHIVRDFMKVFCGGFEDKQDGRTVAYTANFRGFRFVAHDLANFGGLLSDWLLECVDTSRFAWLEVKDDRAFKKDGTLGAGELKEGEAWLSENSSNWHIVSSDEDVKEIFESMVTA
jgi:hypothetical protein